MDFCVYVAVGIDEVVSERYILILDSEKLSSRVFLPGEVSVVYGMKFIRYLAYLEVDVAFACAFCDDFGDIAYGASVWNSCGLRASVE